MNAPTQLPSTEILRECFEYLPETGELKWKTRPANHFISVAAYNIWHSRFCGQIVGFGDFQRSTKRASAVKVRFTIGLNAYNTSAHRIALALNGVEIPDGMVVDHIDGNAYNNRLSNLRVCTPAQNIRNNPGYRTKTRNGLPKGVYPNKNGTFFSVIRHNKKLIRIGTFPTSEEAHQAYLKKAEELHGEFFCKRS